MAQENERPILIKRVKKVQGGGHSSAWKVAYADFTTAMMAFFMLLWLLNVTTDEQRQGLADYFAPTSASSSGSSGSGGVLGGTALSRDGSMNSGAVILTMPKPSDTASGTSTGRGEETSIEKVERPPVEWEEAIAEQENLMFEELEAELRQAIQELPELAELADHLVIDITADGLQIQIIDRDNRSMFKSASAELYDYARLLLSQIAGRIRSVPNRLMITGHTDAQNYARGADYTNWELSADRANAARRVIRGNGVFEDRFAAVRGQAATEPLLPDQPRRAENRRITILLLREAPVVPPNL